MWAKLRRLLRVLMRRADSSEASPARTVAEIVELYPRLLSERNFTQWRNLFGENAVVAKGAADQNRWVVTVDKAVENQKRFFAGKQTVEERFENVRFYEFGNVGVVAADYVLTADADVRRGVDVILLARSGESWRIVALAYDERVRRGG